MCLMKSHVPFQIAHNELKKLTEQSHADMISLYVSPKGSRKSALFPLLVLSRLLFGGPSVLLRFNTFNKWCVWRISVKGSPSASGSHYGLSKWLKAMWINHFDLFHQNWV